MSAWTTEKAFRAFAWSGRRVARRPEEARSSASMQVRFLTAQAKHRREGRFEAEATRLHTASTSWAAGGGHEGALSRAAVFASLRERQGLSQAAMLSRAGEEAKVVWRDE